MPETAESTAYELVATDGKELPFLGNLLPEPIGQAEYTGSILDQSGTWAGEAASSLNLAAYPPEPNEVGNFPAASGLALLDTSNAALDNSLDRVSSVEEDIAFWLSDPELAFIDSASTIEAGSLASLSGSAGLSATSITPAASLSAGTNELRLGGSSETLTIRPAELSVQLQSENAEELNAEGTLGTEGGDDLVGVQKTATTLIKQGEAGPPQLFAQLKSENRQDARVREASYSVANRLGSEGLNLLDSGRMGELSGDTALNPAQAISSHNSGANSVESFVNVLLSIDTTAQSSPSTNVALDQWKAEQATRALELERADVAAKSPFAKVSVPFSQSGWGENLGRQLSMLMARNMDSAQIQLDPPELGPLQVKIQVNNDQVSLHFTTAHGMVKEALEGASVKLQEMFQEEGMELASLDVSEEQTGQQQSKDSQSQALATPSSSGRNSVTTEQEESDGILTLSSNWHQDEGKIDYFI
jgi:flagellar hook-length control protein FliK